MDLTFKKTAENTYTVDYQDAPNGWATYGVLRDHTGRIVAWTDPVPFRFYAQARKKAREMGVNKLGWKLSPEDL